MNTKFDFVTMIALTFPSRIVSSSFFYRHVIQFLINDQTILLFDWKTMQKQEKLEEIKSDSSHWCNQNGWKLSWVYRKKQKLRRSTTIPWIRVITFEVP